MFSPVLINHLTRRSYVKVLYAFYQAIAREEGLQLT